MDLYRGIGEGGESVVFFAGDGETISKLATDFSGDQLGPPAPGTAAKQIANVTLKAVDDGEELLIKTTEPDVADPPPVVPPADESSIKAWNQTLLNRGIRFFAKAAEEGEESVEEGIAIGIVMYPNDGEDGAPKDPDTQNEIFSTKTVRDAAYYWLSNGGQVDLMHSFERLAPGVVQVVGSDVTHGPVTLGEGDNSFECPVGTWLLTTKWDTSHEIWPKIKSGELGAYSPGGRATKIPGEEAA